jgi:hypothetical protein
MAGPKKKQRPNDYSIPTIHMTKNVWMVQKKVKVLHRYVNLINLQP